MLQYTQAYDYYILNSMHVPKHLTLKLEYVHAVMDFLDLDDYEYESLYPFHQLQAKSIHFQKGS